mmetsp:Transcript_94434/g.272934  ORF Transcript_94434/g.272934 Transcript_94434/m.272934 type:complete len:247 (+) Transcript_94434:410-1150(+)
MVDLVELGVLRQRVAQVDAHGLVDLPDAGLLLLVRHGLLDKLQALGVVLMLDRAHVRVRVDVVRRHVHTALGGQLRGAALAEVHVGHARVAALGPWIRRGTGVQVQANVAKLVDPSHEVAVGIGVASPLRAAHGYTHHVAGLDLLHRGQSRHFAIVDDLQGRLRGHLFGQALEDVDDLRLVHVGGHVREDVAPCGLVVGGDGARGAAADRIDLGQLLGCVLHGGQDRVEVVLRVGVRDIPLRLLGI